MSEQPNTELKEQVALALNEILSIPDNAINLASVVINSIAVALKEKREVDVRVRPVLVKAYYKGALKATIVEDDVEETGLNVNIEREEVDEQDEPIKDQWVALDDAEPEVSDILKRLVLSQAALQPGEVWFITTNKNIDNELEKLADVMVDELNKTPTEDVEPETVVH